MSDTIRFPLLQGRGGQKAERQLIIDLMGGPVSMLPQGGAQSYVSIAEWHIGANGEESPFTCVVIEFSAPQAIVIGSGTNPVCLFGEIVLDPTAPPSAANRIRSLIGVLGLNYQATDVPQIPIVQQAGPASDFVGFAQPVSNVACYDALSIGGLTGDITLGEGETVTVRARPIRRRDWVG